MIPILYEKNETEFTSNGLCRLRECTKCEVVEERNSIYECDFDYPVDGANYDQIRLGRIIAVEHDDTDDVQPFDIVSYSKPINGVVSFHAVHISYRQSKIVTSGQNVTSLEAAFTMLKSGQPSNPFTYWTDQTSTTAFPLADNIPRSVRECLGGTEGSILDTYGGEYEWDKFTVRLWNKRGSDVDFAIRYGLNMTDYNDETDSSESYSAILPFWVGNENNVQTIVKGSLVSNGSTTVTGRVDAVAMDFSQEFETQPTTAELENLSRATLTTKQPNLAAQTIKVGFIRLQDSGEYGQFEQLLKCKLCDTVRVEFPRYNMSGRFKIVKTVYDVLLDRFTEMELGTLQTTLSEALGISSGSSSYSTTGGGGASYRLTKDGSTITLTGSDGSSSSVTDANTTYGLSLSGHTVSLVEGGSTASVTVPDNFTSAYETKLNGIEAGAEVNVQSDWSEADASSDAYILNKPTLATVATSGSYDDLSDKPTIQNVAVTQKTTAGTNIADITINNVTTRLYAPSGSGSTSGIVLVISVSAFSSLPQTINDGAITSNMVLLESTLSNPAAQTGDWTVTTNTGSLTISGSISGSTSIVLYLAEVVPEDASIIVVSKSSISSLPTTISDNSIIADHVVIESTLSNPSAQTGDWTVTTSAGTATISGTISGTTDITLVLGQEIN